MGIKCIRTERVISEPEPIFLYQNMIPMKKNKSPKDEYQFLEKIGKGSFSQVYRAKNLLTGSAIWS